MKALVLKKPKILELQYIPEYSLTEEDHVLIKVETCGICGSDLRYWGGENPWSLHTLGRHVDNPPNLVMGHEYAGKVVKVNAKKYEHLLGKRVGVQAFKVCGKCKFCTSGRENLCRKMIHMGHAQGWGEMDFYPGAYAEYCLGWAGLLHGIPDHISYAEASMADILCVAVHVVGRTNIYEESNILCFGGGPAGLSIAQLARIKGARNIFISDPSPLAREVIAKYKKDAPGYRTNQCSMSVAIPSDVYLPDPPCLREIDTRIQDGKLHFLYIFVHGIYGADFLLI